ncbi:MAG: hypothetical protein ACXW0Q_05695 [Methylovulum sp.]
MLVDISIVVVWVTSAIIACVIGNRKGNPIAGALVGIVLGPIGVIAALISGDKNRIACPQCAEKIMKKAKLCPYCKSNV